MPDGKLVIYQNNIYYNGQHYLISNTNRTSVRGYILMQSTQIPQPHTDVRINIPMPLNTYNTFTIEINVHAKSGYKYSSSYISINGYYIFSGITINEAGASGLVHCYNKYDTNYSPINTDLDKNYITINASGGYSDYGIQSFNTIISIQ